MKWKMLDPRMTMDNLGLIPFFLHEDDERGAVEQFNERYISGWVETKGFKLQSNNVLTYPGDTPLKPLAETKLRDELILFYDYSFIAVVQPDRSFQVCRMD